MLIKTGASAGLVAIAATAGTLLTFSPASAQSAPATARAAAAVTRASATTVRRSGDDWWWWSSHRFRHHRRHFCGHGFCNQRFFGDFDDFGDFGGFNDFDGFGFNRNVNVLSNDVSVGVSNVNNNVAVAGVG